MSSRSQRPRRAQRAAAILLWAGVAYSVIAGAAYLGHSTSGQRLAQASPPPTAARPLASRGAPSCPLSLGQQVKAVRAFGEMVPVFRHPRCLNCHGGFDITSDEHEGSDFAKSSGLDPRALLTAEQRKQLHEGCDNCHTNVRGSLTRLDGTQLAGWLVAPPPMLWDGKSDEELCVQMKRFEPTGDQFVDHLETDHDEIQFIEAAFNGDRALGEEGLKSYGVAVEKPPGTQAELVAKARKWAELVGDGYTASPECGCVGPKIELTMRTQVTGAAQGHTMTGEMSATVKLTADSSDLVYRGEAPIQHGRYSASVPMPSGCDVAYAPEGGVLAVKEARLDAADDGRTTIGLVVHPTNSGGTMTMRCPGLPRAVVMPILPVSQEWRFVHEPDRSGLDYRFAEFETPTGASPAEGRTLLGRKEVTRTTQREGVTVTAKTTFEFWSVPGQPK